MHSRTRLLRYPVAFRARTSCKRSLSTLPDVASSSAHYDLIVIGSGPSAQKCAVESAREGKKVCVVDKKGMMGGVCVHTGTVPSKTFREAMLHLTSYRHQGFYGRAYQPWRERISMPELLRMVQKVETAETGVVVDQLQREGVEVITGTARFETPDAAGRQRCIVLKTEPKAGHESESSAYRHVDASTTKMIISADKFLIACGTRPLRPAHIPFDGKSVFDSDQLLWGGVRDLPKDLIVVGAGVIGMEYASMINVAPGTKVTIVDPRDEVLGFADREVVEELMHSMRSKGARFILNDKVERVEKRRDDIHDGRQVVVAYMASGKRLVGDSLLYTMGRQGNSDSLNLSAADLHADARGLLEVNSFYQTTNPKIYACGDIIGFPALASTSMEQGRRAAIHMWSGQVDIGPVLDGTESEDHSEVKSVFKGGFLGRSSEQLFPYGIYTIPEISMVGKTEAQLTAEGVPYEIGVADFTELAKGQMLGGADGFLKLIYHSKSYKLLGVHSIGDGSTEIIHIGQVVMSQGGTIGYFLTAVFNYPTLAEAYNVAARDAMRKIVPTRFIRKEIS